MSLNKQEQVEMEEARKVVELVSSPGWVEVLKPYLEGKLRHSWVDPRKTTDKDDFFHQYSVAWGFSHAADEIMRSVEAFVQKFDYLKKKDKGEVSDNFKIGA